MHWRENEMEKIYVHRKRAKVAVELALESHNFVSKQLIRRN